MLVSNVAVSGRVGRLKLRVNDRLVSYIFPKTAIDRGRGDERREGDYGQLSFQHRSSRSRSLLR